MVDEVTSLKFAEVVGECAETSAEAYKAVEMFISALRSVDNELEGISLLDVKNRELLSYMAELAILMSQMSCGKSIKDHPSVLRACKHRTILEKIRPIEQKMKSQIDRLLQGVSNGEVKVPLRARPDQMEFDDESKSNDEDADSNQDEKTQRKYVPPKMMAVKYEEENDSKQENAIKKARQRAIQSSLVQELRQQYGDAPEELREQSSRKYKLDKDRETYEEDNYVRLRMNKADKRRQQLLSRDDAVNDLFNFGDYMLRDESGEALSHATRRKANGSGISKRKKSRSERKMEQKRKSKAKNRILKRKQ